MANSMKDPKFCEYRKGSMCEPLTEECFNLAHPVGCGFRGSYGWLTISEKDRSITAKLKKQIIPFMTAEWKQYAKTKTGGRHMTARALENGITETLKREVQAYPEPKARRKYVIAKNINDKAGTIIDCTIEKEGKPTTLISIKTWLGADDLRESLADAYLIKKHDKSKDSVKFYLITLNSLESGSISQGWLSLSSPDIDGVYSLNSSPSFDDLVEELKRIYQ